jgi:hypothetical protein
MNMKLATAKTIRPAAAPIVALWISAGVVAMIRDAQMAAPEATR